MSTRNREWESSISSSPITHRFVKRPLSHLRRKTESLLSDITGANVTQDEQLKDKELGKRSTCRHCDVRFHDEMALNTHFNLLPDHFEGHNVRRSPTRQRSSASIQAQSPTYPSHERSRSNTSSSFNPASPHQRERSDSSGRMFSNSPGSTSWTSPISNPLGLHSRKPSLLDLDMVAAQENGGGDGDTTVSSTRESRNMEAGKASAALAAKNREAQRLKEEAKNASMRQRPSRSGSESAVEALSEIRSQLPGAIFPGLASPTSPKNKFKKVQDRQVLGDDDEEDGDGEQDGSSPFASAFGSASRFSTLPRSTNSSSRPPVPPRASTMRIMDPGQSIFTPPLDAASSSSSAQIGSSTAGIGSRRHPPPPPPPPPRTVPRRSTNPFIPSKIDPSGPFSGSSFDVDVSAMSPSDQKGVEHDAPILPPISNLHISPILPSNSNSNPFRKFMEFTHTSSPIQGNSSLPYLNSEESQDESESQPFQVNNSALQDLPPPTSSSSANVKFSKSTSKAHLAYCPNCSQGFETARQVIDHLDTTRCGEDDDDEAL